MRFFCRHIFPVIILITSLLFMCEYLIYYITLHQCAWPLLNHTGTDKYDTADQLKAFILADVHILGRRNGHWFDKLRREWQMYRSYQTAILLHKPEVVFILGDLLDEGSFSLDELHQVYVRRFFELFSPSNGAELFIVPGNHDIGFHFGMTPYLEYRFRKSMNTSLVKLVTRKNVNFVLLNSMAMEGDGCQLCTDAKKSINYISASLRCANGTGKCYKGMKLKKYSRPIIMQHFPLYRENDLHCNEFDEAPAFIKAHSLLENRDCLSEKSSAYLLDALMPRAIFSGHTHHGCLTIHNTVPEYSISSFNWRNKENPSFAMVTFTADTYAVYKCFIPREYTVIGIYFIGIIFIFLYINYNKSIIKWWRVRFKKRVWWRRLHYL